MDKMILVDKPAGISSFGVVSKIRGAISKVMRGEAVEGKVLGVGEEVERIGKELREEYEARGEIIPKRIKVGHAGTLDPFATGLLIVLIGKATKRAGEFLKLNKEYEAEVWLGAVSSTGDPEGEIVEKSVEKVPTRGEIEGAVRGLEGEWEQRVPKYSAVKINGERAYKLARAGKEVEMPVKKVHIYNIEVVEYEWPRLVIKCKVSSGTYIRALGEEIGARLGVGGYLTKLRRVSIGEYRLV